MIQMCYAFRDDDEEPKEVFVHHAAGLALRRRGRGFAGSSYIDSVIPNHTIKPDRDVKNGWTGLSEGTREERLYYCQNWRADVSAILTDTGKMVEWVKYSAYGVPYSLPAGDTDSDGDWDATDDSAISGSGSYDVRQDTDLNGKVESDDITHANSITGGYQTLGRWLLGADTIGNRRGYAGYEFDPTFVGNKRSLYHVRYRVYDAGVGRWTRRDPLGYIDGMGLYEYVRSSPLSLTDPNGLACSSCGHSSRTDFLDMPSKCSRQDDFDPGSTGPWDLECPPGYYYNIYANRCVPVNPLILPAPRRDDETDNPNSVACGIACDNMTGSPAAVACIDGRAILCNCIARKWGSGREDLNHLTQCTNSCIGILSNRLNCGTRTWNDGRPGEHCDRCSLMECVTACHSSFDCNSLAKRARTTCEGVKLNLENQRRTMCRLCRDGM